MRRAGELKLRAVVLAAGRGERLRPLTDVLPKPLLPVAGRPVALHTLTQLAELGCEAAALNLHHLGDSVRERLGRRVGPMELTYSEEAELQGTLGALAPLERFLSGADLALVVNGDSLCRWPLKALLKRHLKSGARATLLLSRRADARRFGGGVGVGRDGRVVSFRSGDDADGAARRRVFAGAHVFAPALVAGLEAKPADFVTDLYQPLLAAGGHIAGLETSRAWHDLGTAERYRVGAYEYACGGWLRRRMRPIWRGPNVHVHERARVKRSVIESDASVAEEARVEDSLVLPGAEVGPGARVRRSVVGPEVVLPPGAWVDRQMVLRKQMGLVPREGDSVMGGLVYVKIQ